MILLFKFLKLTLDVIHILLENGTRFSDERDGDAERNSQPRSSEAATEHHFFVAECGSVRRSMNANGSSQLEEQSQDQ